MFVSATIADEIERLAASYMREPVEKLIAPARTKSRPSRRSNSITSRCSPGTNIACCGRCWRKENPDLAIVFCRTKHGAEAGEEAARRWDRMPRDSRQPGAEQARPGDENFRGGKFDVLIATDLASRGIDVADISHIINFDIPEDPEVYVHRVGRTARMGATGKAFTFVTRDQGDELTRVES